MKKIIQFIIKLISTQAFRLERAVRKGVKTAEKATDLTSAEKFSLAFSVTKEALGKEFVAIKDEIINAAIEKVVKKLYNS